MSSSPEVTQPGLGSKVPDPFHTLPYKKAIQKPQTMSSNTNGREARSQRKPLGMLTQSVIVALLGECENNFVPVLLFYGEGEIAGEL